MPLDLSKSLSYKIVSIGLYLIALLINNIKKLVTSLLHLHLCVPVFSLLLPLKCSTCVSLISSSSIKVVQCYIFFFILENLKKILEIILENIRISCLNLDGHHVRLRKNYERYLKLILHCIKSPVFCLKNMIWYPLSHKKY